MAAPYPPLPLPTEITASYIHSHDLTYHVLSAGERGKPLILCLHGFPELAFSWRKVMPAIATEGYYVVAYDQRGYGRTTGWDTGDFSSVDLNTFSFTGLVRDAIILINVLGYEEVACVIGHDFGGVAAANCAVMRPDIFKAVVLMSHPFKGTPSLPLNTVTSPEPISKKEDIHKALAELPEARKAYKWWYSTSAAAPDMDHPKEGLHEFLRGYFHLKSADWKGNDPKPLKAWQASEIAKLPYYYVMPLDSGMRESVQLGMKDEDASTVSKLSSRWLPDTDLQVYVEEWSRTGFQGGLNWYRIATDPSRQKDFELFSGRKITIPTIYIAGKQDWGTYQEPGAIEKMESGEVCTQFKGAHLLDGAGHWVQQEQPDEVIKIIQKFLKDVIVDRISH